MRRKTHLALAIAIASALVLGGPPATARVEPGDKPVGPPNIVYVLVDDAYLKTLDYMPLTQQLVRDEGAELKQFIFNQALCCPSRATMFRGQYSQNTGITTNTPPDGGYAGFYGNGLEASTLGTWLDDAGYATAYLGKYFNGYAEEAGLPPTHVPPGWDRWFALFSDADDGYDYDVNEDGVITHRGFGPENYATDVLAAEATRFISSDLATDQFLLWINPKVPHEPSVPAERHKELFKDLSYPRTPSFNEADVSDKPSHIRKLPLLSRKQKARIDRDYRNHLRALQAVDEMMAAIVDTLEAQNELNNTYIVFASDNGLHMGEHRMTLGKNTVYEEDIHVPAFIRGPGIAPGLKVTELIGNVDLPVTFADAAGVVPADFVDGRSFLPIVQGQTIPWRNSYLLGRGGRMKAFAGLRTLEYAYVEYASGEGEFYDLRVDPDQLVNTYATMPSALKMALHDRVTVLRTCARQACRDAEAAPLLAAIAPLG